MTVPALKELRRAFPQAEITLQTRPAAAGIFEDAGFIDLILPIAGSSSKFTSSLKQVREIRSEHFDVGVIFTNSIEAAVVQRLGHVQQRFGYAAQGRSALLTHAFPVPDWKDSRHEVYYYLDLVKNVEKQLGVAAFAGEYLVSPELKFSDRRRAAAREWLKQQGVSNGRRLIALGVGSTNSRAKRWPAERMCSSLTLSLWI